MDHAADGFYRRILGWTQGSTKGTQMTIDIKIDCEIPQVPNFLKTSNGQVPITAVTEEALKQLGAAWTKALIMRARQMRTDAAEARPK